MSIHPQAKANSAITNISPSPHSQTVTPYPCTDLLSVTGDFLCHNQTSFVLCRLFESDVQQQANRTLGLLFYAAIISVFDKTKGIHTVIVHVNAKLHHIRVLPFRSGAAAELIRLNSSECVCLHWCLPEKICRASVYAGCWSTMEKFITEQITRDGTSGRETK